MAHVPDARNMPASNGRRASRSAADQVASILTAAEAAADQLRAEAETRVRERVAEGDRAADYRIHAAEQEAAEILAAARAEADQLLARARERDEQSRSNAASEALALITTAQQQATDALAEASQRAAAVLAEANERAAVTRREAETHSRELLSEARLVAEQVRGEGLELVSNFRQMGDSLRANAERLLRDVQGIHTSMVRRLEQAGPAGARANGAGRGDGERPRQLEGVRGRRRFDPATRSDALDVPEFIPRS